MEFSWSEQRLRWFASAAKRTLYYKRLAEILLKDLPSGASVLDMGAGAGAFALELAKAGAIVTAVEQQALACAHMENFFKENNMFECINIVQGDWRTVELKPADLVLLSYCNGAVSEWLKVKSLALKRVAVLTFLGLSWDGSPKKNKSRETAPQVAASLTENKETFSFQPFSEEFGQPLDRKEDFNSFAVEYFKDSEDLDKLAASIVEEPGGFYLPHRKESGLFLVCLKSQSWNALKIQ